MHITEKESEQFATTTTSIVNLTIETDLFSSVLVGASGGAGAVVAMNHSIIHVLFAIETMATTIWRHLFLCDCQPLNTHKHVRARARTHITISNK